MTQVNTHTDRYAVFAKLPTTEHNTEPPNVMKGFQAVLDNFDQTELNAAYGWTSSDEHAFTASVTEAGGMVHASDFAYNLAVLSQLPPYVAPPPHHHRHRRHPTLAACRSRCTRWHLSTRTGTTSSCCKMIGLALRTGTIRCVATSLSDGPTVRQWPR